MQYFKKTGAEMAQHEKNTEMKAEESRQELLEKLESRTLSFLVTCFSLAMRTAAAWIREKLGKRQGQGGQDGRRKL